MRLKHTIREMKSRLEHLERSGGALVEQAVLRGRLEALYEHAGGLGEKAGRSALGSKR